MPRVRAWKLALAVACTIALPAQPASAEVIASDLGFGDPIPFWGKLDCQDSTRHESILGGGDPHGTASGAPQSDYSFRRLHVFDGDDVYGERCELGLNNRWGPTTFYRSGNRLITQIALRLPADGINATSWQVVTQMKQVGPAANSGGTPVLELGAWLGRWHLSQSLSKKMSSQGRELWSAPARADVWTLFQFNVRYSTKRKKGFVQVSADLNGDGDFADPEELGPRIRTFTLKVEIRGGEKDGIKPGRAIPSHLRAGIYHDTALSCPPPDGCYIDIDNVGIVRP